MFVPFMIIYFILVALPYFAYSVPILGSFVSEGASKLVYRGVIALVFILYAVCIAISHHIKPNYPWLILFFILLITSMLVPFFSPTFLVTRYTDPQYLYTTVSSIQIGMEDNISSIISLFFDLSFAYCFMFIFPSVLKNRRQVIYILLPVIGLMTIECLYSVIFEASQYAKLFSYVNNGFDGYDIVIQASFGSKNDYGDFLLQGIIASSICFVIAKTKHLKIFSATCGIAFYIFSGLSLCKTALIGASLLFLFGFIVWISFSYKNHVRRNSIILGVTTAFILLAIAAVLVIPQLNSVVNSLFIKSSIKTFDERLELWNLALYMMRGPSQFFGYSKTLANYNLYYMSGETNRWFHNGFIYIYCSYGLIGLSIYILLLSFIFLTMVKNLRFNKNIALVDISIIISFFVLTMAEQVILGISGSAGVFIYNFSVVLLPIALSISYAEKGELYESFNN